MAQNLGIIEAARAVIDVLPLPLDQVLFLRQAARQRATRNSTRIEGNTLMEWFGVSATTARDWLKKWRYEDLLEPTRASAQRIRSYALAKKWAQLVQSALKSASDKRG